MSGTHHRTGCPPAPTSVNDIEKWFCASENEQAAAIREVLAEHLPGLGADEIDNIVAEILAVRLGE
jgi:hypothetical protein